MTRLFASTSHKLLRVAYNDPVSSPIASPSAVSPVSSPFRGFLTQLRKLQPAQRPQMLEKMIGARTPDSKPKFLEELKRDTELMSDPALSSIVNKNVTAPPPPTTPSAEVPQTETQVQPQQQPSVPAAPSVPSAADAGPASLDDTINQSPTTPDVYDLAPGDTDERKPYDLAPEAPNGTAPQTNVPRPTQPNSMVPRNQLTPEQLKQKYDYYNGKSNMYNQMLQGLPNQPGQQTNTTPQQPSPWYGNQQQNSGIGGWMGNQLGRALKFPGRAVRDIGQGVKNFGDQVGQGWQNFKNDFTNAESDGKILTASASSAYNMIAKY